MTIESTVANTHFSRASGLVTAPVSQSNQTAGNRLLGLATKLTGILALLAYLAIGWGHIQPTASAASAVGLGQCSDVPCFKNLVPGRTRWTENLAELNRQLLLHGNTPHIALSASVDNNFLGEIVVPLPADTNVTVMASDIVQLYGVPCRVDVTFYTRWSSVALRYPRLIVQISRVGYALSPNAPVERVTLTGPANNAADPCALSPSPAPITQAATIQRHWRGFTSLQRYLTDSP